MFVPGHSKTTTNCTFRKPPCEHAKWPAHVTCRSARGLANVLSLNVIRFLQRWLLQRGTSISVMCVRTFCCWESTGYIVPLRGNRSSEWMTSRCRPLRPDRWVQLQPRTAQLPTWDQLRVRAARLEKDMHTNSVRSPLWCHVLVATAGVEFTSCLYVHVVSFVDV